MKDLTEQRVGSFSPNAAADANARALAKTNAFPKLCVSEDRSLIFGECSGSAKDNLTGAQDLLREFNALFRTRRDREETYSRALLYLNAAHSLYKRGKEYLEHRLDAPEPAMGTDSDIEELLGQTWQFDELEEQGLVASNVELVQLSFDSYSNAAALGIPCFACTPGRLPDLLEGALKGRDLMELSKTIGSRSGSRQ